MKFIFAFLVIFASQTQAQVSPQSVVRAYVDKAYLLYSNTLKGARQLQSDLSRFLNNPTEENLAIAKQSWIEARKSYSQTEIYRFYGSPIDAEGGPEGLINAWPLDEVYIGTIIERADLYPKLDGPTLHELNEKDGEKNISTGWHAIEYMLWGKDLSPTGPGARPASDYASTNPLASRRAAYLAQIAALLVQDLESVQVQWDLNRPNSYAQQFLKAKDSLTNMLIGVTKMSGAELSQERMFVALDTHQQEEEQSCFSDTTHLDIYYNFTGIKNVLTGGVLDLIRSKDRSVANEIQENLDTTEKAILAIPAPFDQAILNEPGRGRILAAINALEDLTESVRQGAVTLGLELP